MTLPRNDEEEEWSDGFAVRSLLLLLLPQFAVIPNAVRNLSLIRFYLSFATFDFIIGHSTGIFIAALQMLLLITAGLQIRQDGLGAAISPQVNRALCRRSICHL